MIAQQRRQRHRRTGVFRRRERGDPPEVVGGQRVRAETRGGNGAHDEQLGAEEIAPRFGGLLQHALADQRCQQPMHRRLGETGICDEIGEPGAAIAVRRDFPQQQHGPLEALGSRQCGSGIGRANHKKTISPTSASIVGP